MYRIHGELVKVATVDNIPRGPSTNDDKRAASGYDLVKIGELFIPGPQRGVDGKFCWGR